MSKNLLVVIVTALGAACSGGGGGGGNGVPLDPPVDPPALALHSETAALTELSSEAVSIAPAWLRHDLGISLRKQEAVRADELASLLVELDDPRLIDEVAFTIAHVSPEVLASPGFYPQLLVENARGVYDRDEDLDYVELIDEGEPGVDDDFWTTASYRFEMKGELVDRVVDRDIYYWYVVHPKLEDENPWYIDSWATCSASTLECAATPDEGWHWRDFLWEKAADTCPEEGLCPALEDWLPGVEYVWNGRPGGDAEGALREIISFMHYSPVDDYRWLVFGAYGERSIQPNRIYGLGRGNCGEWADMTSALARTALIPNVNSTPASWDHTWNAFYDINWIEWEPVNGWVDHAYNAPFSNYATRGDGFVMLQTPDYTDDIFTMEVEVYDVDDAPIAGASVAVYSPWQIGEDMYWSYAGEAPTDEEGVARFPLVAMQDYAVRIETPVGTWPEAENSITYASSGIAVDQVDVQAYNLAVSLPDPIDLSEVGYGADTQTDAALTLEFSDLQTRFTTVSQRFGTTYTEPGPAPEINVFLVDEDNLAALEAGEPVEAAWVGGLADVSFDLPSSRQWYLVLANDEEISSAAVGELSVSIASSDDTAWTGPSELSVPFEILPQGYMVISITPAQ